MNFMYHLIMYMETIGASIAMVESYAQALPAIDVMKGPLPLTRWPSTGLSKMTRCLVMYANDRTRSSGLIAEIVVTLFTLSCTAFRKINIVLSVLISGCVRRNVICVLKSRVRPMSV